MPNSVYHRTHDTLAHFVSGRVATRVLDEGLGRAGTTADTVSIDAMRDVLMSTVIDDLADLLPRSGMERTFRALLDDLERTQAAASAATPPPDPAALEHRDILATEPGLGAAAAPDVQDEAERAAPTDAVEGTDAADAIAAPDGTVEETSGADPADAAEAEAPPEAAPESDDEPAVEPDPEPRPEAATEPPFASAADDAAVESDDAVGARPDPSPPQSSALDSPAGSAPPDEGARGDERDALASPAARVVSIDLASALVRFAEIENVSFVATARDDGQLVDARGEGIDAVALARRSASFLRLMHRRGHVTTFTLQTGDAILVLAPFGDDLVIVVGTPQLNLGAVFAARSALEEES